MGKMVGPNDKMVSISFFRCNLLANKYMGKMVVGIKFVIPIVRGVIMVLHYPTPHNSYALSETLILSIYPLSFEVQYNCCSPSGKNQVNSGIKSSINNCN